jgi:trypsin
MKFTFPLLLCLAAASIALCSEVIESTLQETDQSHEQEGETSASFDQEEAEEAKEEPDMAQLSRRQRRKQLGDKLREERDLKFSNVTDEGVQQRIVGGNAADLSKYPYFVHGFGCGAILIHRDIVLSAAHCDGAFWNEVLVGPAANARTGLAQWRTIANNRMYVHPNFSWDTMENDFMLFKIQPVTLQNLRRALRTRRVILNTNPAFPATGNGLNVIGYGALKENGAQSNVLQDVTVNTIASYTCDNAYGGSVFPATQLCAGVQGGGKDSCQGDSGGPLLSGNTLVGIVSWGYGCARNGYPGVYSRVSSAQSWIRSMICQLSDFKPAYC